MTIILNQDELEKINRLELEYKRLKIQIIFLIIARLLLSVSALSLFVCAYLANENKIPNYAVFISIFFVLIFALLGGAGSRYGGSNGVYIFPMIKKAKLIKNQINDIKEFAS